MGYGYAVSHSNAPHPLRFDTVDALRGLAMVWMTAFHFCFDLNQFGFLRQDFYTDPLWTWQRTAIVTLFLFCAGIGQAIAAGQAQGWARFGRRWLQVVGSALLVSLGSFLMFPNSFIYFGVLHGLAIMLLIARVSAGWGSGLWWWGALAITSPFAVPHLVSFLGATELFNSRALNWLGWITRKPVTEDYVPLFPWLGVMWWGVAAGQRLLTRYPAILQASLPAPGRALARLGRWSLSYYLLHQPVLIGLLMLLAWT